SVKLFPRNCQPFVNEVAEKLFKETGKKVEVMINGDGAFKDPVGKIWELADPVVSPAFTQGLVGTPNEIKLKYLADNNFADLSGEELKTAVSNFIKQKDDNLVGKMESQGTTPRRLTDLIGSLADLTSGSGDKGTPIIYIQNYFDNYTV
ncbi:MAG: coenzyme F420-0:L-glutamate ligase, partial [Oscillospiraceae bacterium]